MSTQDNIQLIGRYSDEVFDKARLEAADEFLADDYVNHFPPPGMEGSREGFNSSSRRCTAP